MAGTYDSMPTGHSKLHKKQSHFTQARARRSFEAAMTDIAELQSIRDRSKQVLHRLTAIFDSVSDIPTECVGSTKAFDQARVCMASREFVSLVEQVRADSSSAEEALKKTDDIHQRLNQVEQLKQQLQIQLAESEDQKTECQRRCQELERSLKQRVDRGQVSEQSIPRRCLDTSDVASEEATKGDRALRDDSDAATRRLSSRVREREVDEDLLISPTSRHQSKKQYLQPLYSSKGVHDIDRARTNGAALENAATTPFVPRIEGPQSLSEIDSDISARLLAQTSSLDQLSITGTAAIKDTTAARRLPHGMATDTISNVQHHGRSKWMERDGCRWAQSLDDSWMDHVEWDFMSTSHKQAIIHEVGTVMSRLSPRDQIACFLQAVQEEARGCFHMIVRNDRLNEKRFLDADECLFQTTYQHEAGNHVCFWVQAIVPPRRGLDNKMKRYEPIVRTQSQ